VPRGAGPAARALLEMSKPASKLTNVNAGRIKRKPRNAKAKRVMLAREPKVHEEERGALFMRGTHTTDLITEILKDLVSTGSLWNMLLPHLLKKITVF
jgi:hypothetical protein